MSSEGYLGIKPGPRENTVIQRLADFPSVVAEAGHKYSPSIIANYTYDLVKEYNTFYHDCAILKEQDQAVRALRLAISDVTARIVRNAMGLLGIKVPERM